MAPLRRCSRRRTGLLLCKLSSSLFASLLIWVHPKRNNTISNISIIQIYMMILQRCNTLQMCKFYFLFGIYYLRQYESDVSWPNLAWKVRQLIRFFVRLYNTGWFRWAVPVPQVRWPVVFSRIGIVWFGLRSHWIPGCLRSRNALSRLDQNYHVTKLDRGS